VQPRIREQSQAMRSRASKATDYGACPKTPHAHGLTWVEAKDALQRMKLLTAQMAPSSESDRQNINKFLNRLLGLPVKLQNDLFSFYNAIFRWVVLSAKAQGDVDTGVGLIQGESVRVAGEPEIVFRDPRSSATSLIHSVRVDTGLSWRSACEYLQAVLANPAVRPTNLGGSTGFWQQKKTNRVVLAVELPSTHTDRRFRMHRILRPTLHTSAKPQYVPMAKLIARYLCMRNPADAEPLWKEAFKEDEGDRFEDVRLLCGAILPIWTPLIAALRAVAKPGKRDSALTVKKCNCDGTPLVGVVLNEKLVAQLKANLKSQEGGRLEDIEEATRKRKADMAEMALKRAVARKDNKFASSADSKDTQVSGKTAEAKADSDFDDSDDDEEEEEAMPLFSNESSHEIQHAATSESAPAEDDGDLLDMLGD